MSLPASKLMSRWGIRRVRSATLAVAFSLVAIIQVGIMILVLSVTEDPVDPQYGPMSAVIAAIQPWWNPPASAARQTLSVPEYSTIIQWDVKPNFTDFDYMPIRQLCRWIKGPSSERKNVSDMNQWTVHTIPKYHRKTGASNQKRTLLLLQYDCQRIGNESPYGTGNWVQLLYIMRLAVTWIEMDMLTSCRDTIQYPERLVMPWLMGHYSSAETTKVQDTYFGKNRVNRYCPLRGWSEYPVGWMLPWIRQDLQRMAIALLGVPSDDPFHPAHEWSAGQQHNNVVYFSDTTLVDFSSPLIPNTTIDDAAIHFRCGDIMTSEETYFRFLKYHEYTRRLDPRVMSIGIITQPFEKTDQSRERDQATATRSELCKRVILGFQDYLQLHFPRARITIHNGPDETVALAYARLIMAKYQTFASPDSSFSVYPALASFGKSYHLMPLRSPYSKSTTKNIFLKEIKEFLDKDALFEWMFISNEDALFGIETLHMEQRDGGDAIVEWFVNETLAKPVFPNLTRFDNT